MIYIICGGKDFAFVDIIDFNGLQNTCFHEMTDAAFGHDRYGYGFLNAAYHSRIAHAGNAAGGPYICRDPFQGHDRAGACLLGNTCLLYTSFMFRNHRMEISIWKVRK